MYVLYELSSKITLDKVNNSYPFHPNTRVDIVEKTRLRMDIGQATEFAKSFGLFLFDHLFLFLADHTAEEKFTTECFFLTMQCQNIGLHSLVTSMGNIKRHLFDMKRALEVRFDLLRFILVFRLPSSNSMLSKLMPKQRHNKLNCNG